MPMYFLDANCLIDAGRGFPMDETPDFWNWLLTLGANDVVRIPEKVFTEINSGKDFLVPWVKANKGSLIVKTTECLACLSQVATHYTGMSESEVEELGADPFLIAHALSHGEGIVVTNEAPSNATVAKNMKIPSICKKLNTSCITMNRFLWETRALMPK